MFLLSFRFACVIRHLAGYKLKFLGKNCQTTRKQHHNGASQKLVAVSQNGSSGGTTGSGAEMKPSVVGIGQRHIVALGVTSGHSVESGGSGGARTRHKSNNDGPFAATPSQIASQKPVSPGHDLSRVVAAWSKLPSPFKAAILAIINSAEGQP